MRRSDALLSDIFDPRGNLKPGVDLTLFTEDLLGSLVRKRFSQASAKGAILSALLVARNSQMQLKKAEADSNTDHLTGIANRRAFDVHLDTAICELRHNKTIKIVFAFVDLDKFKNINTRHGFNGGDKAIVETARVLKSIVRKNDQVIRWGGDEFALIMYDRENTEDFPDVAMDRVHEALSCMWVRDERHVFSFSGSVGHILLTKEKLDAIQNKANAMEISLADEIKGFVEKKMIENKVARHQEMVGGAFNPQALEVVNI